MSDLAILVPVLGRPHRVAPVLASIEATVDARVVFIPDPDDAPEIAALDEAGVQWFAHAGNYADKINAGILHTAEPLIFTGADDLEFRPGWFEEAKTHLGNGCEVVGVNDLCSVRVQAGLHATHFLMTRAYAEMPTIDGDPGPFHNGYRHWFVDDEFVGTAQHRRAIRFALDSHVAHLHPMVSKAPDDATYRKGRSRRRQDRTLFRNRRALWT